MITINKLKIDDDLKNIEVEVTTSDSNARFTRVFVWDHTNFRDYAKAIDVSYLLQGTSNSETFVISAEQINKEFITGLFFVEFRTDESPIPLDNGLIQNQFLGVIANLFKYNECLLEKVLQLDIQGCGKVTSECKECEGNIYLLSTLLSALNSAIQASFFEEAVKIAKELESICDSCSPCPDFENTTSLNGVGLGYQIVNNEILANRTDTDDITGGSGGCTEPECQESLVAKCVLAHVYLDTVDPCTLNLEDLCYNLVLYYPNTVSDSVPWLSPVYSDPGLTQQVNYPNNQVVSFKYLVGNTYEYDLLTYDANQTRFEASPCIQ